MRSGSSISSFFLIPHECVDHVVGACLTYRLKIITIKREFCFYLGVLPHQILSFWVLRADGEWLNRDTFSIVSVLYFGFDRIV